MKIAIATFVKTPGLSPIKTRLAAAIGTDRAEKFFLKSVEATLVTLQIVAEKISANESNQVDLYWAVAERQALENKLWQSMRQISQGEGNLGERLANVYCGLRESYDCVGLYGADSPQIDPQNIIAGIEMLLNGFKNDQIKFPEKTVIGPTEDGGFYFFLSCDKIPRSLWESVTYSNENTLAELKEKLNEAGIRSKELGREFDIDLAADYARLIAQNSKFRV